jgi:ABC-type phosphate/phosphonate transport system ATPase subunit
MLPRIRRSARRAINSKLIVIRGNSGSGKSSTARTLRDLGGRGVALVEQDYLRRIVLREHDVPDGANIGLIAQTVRYALHHEYHVILEGILYTAHYEAMLEALVRDHRGEAYHYYFDISFEETVRRHTESPRAGDFTPAQMRAWYIERDLLRFTNERVIPESATLEQTVDRIAAETGLLDGART